ncbi:toll/interleukin-1 receptor domain-containing protein [Methylobacterium sp. J-078]|uniref:toll/interleukin-1 receptor domain-containing protein n=1 Tax=Methylobacterium sp. J-078 TaxID=2836657 RepID=UPI001FB87F80|nr:toll/interleukin-1 receptor domain-containing protein [Methylobacterium sp. J-078]MCJ2046386.1 toll/interleukin-1 receptor domain-containing protein [Methylobacterium sp. J-078]
MLAKTDARPGRGKSSPAKVAAPRVRAADPSKSPRPATKAKKAKIRIFVSYCHVNAVQQAKLQVHLAQLKRDEVETWFDGDMAAGDKLSTEISRKLREADIFVALMSPEYIHSHWCQLEYNRAMRRRANGAMRVVVVIVRPCGWKDTGASELKVLPRDGRTVSDWRTMDHAFADVTEGIKGAVRAVRASKVATPGAKPARASRSAAAAKAKQRAPRAKATPGARPKAKPGAKGGRTVRKDAVG